MYNLLLYQYEVQVVNFSDYYKGELCIAISYLDQRNKPVVIEVDGVIDKRYKRALQVVEDVFTGVLADAVSSSNTPFAPLLY